MKKRAPLLLCVLLAAILIYRFAFYVPPLIDTEKRNILDQAIDFVSCGWHLTKCSIMEKYTKNNNAKIKKEYFMAGWYREIFLLKSFGISKDELSIFLRARKQDNYKNFKKLLFEFVTSPPPSRAAILQK
jgi:hypothetical protein